MFFKLKNRNGEARKLSKQVREYMGRRFLLLPEYLDLLRCFEYVDVINGKPVRAFCIFSPYRAKERNIVIRSIHELNRYPELLFFQGHMDSQGIVYVADRRPPCKTWKSELIFN